MRALGNSIRSRLLLLVLVATLPLLAFAAALLHHAYRVSAGLIQDTALSTAKRVAAAVDAQITQAETIGYAFAEMPPGDLSNTAAFEDAAAHVLATAGLDGAVALIDRDGNVLAHTLRAGNGPIAQAEDLEIVRRVFDTGRPQIANVHIGALSHQAQIAVHVPLLSQGPAPGNVRYDIAVIASARVIGAGTEPNMLPQGWFTLIVDRSGHLVVDTSAGPQVAGDDVPPPAAALFARSGVGFGAVALDGREPVLLGYIHDQPTGWIVAAGVPEHIVGMPLRNSIVLLAAAGIAGLLASLGLAWLIGRSIVNPLAALAHAAADPTAAGGAGLEILGRLAEVQAVARSLQYASETISARDRDREAALRRAETSEGRLLIAQEIGEIGTWEIDALTGTREWSQGEFKLYGIDPAVGAPHGDAWLPFIHPDDVAQVRATEARAREAPTTYRMLFRIVRPTGEIRWLRAAGRSEFADGVPVRLIGSTIDVTERQEAERSLRQSATRLEGEVADRRRDLDESEQRFRTYFEYSSDALLVVRVEEERFVYEMINKAAERLFGLTQDQVVGNTPEDVFPPETAFAKEAAYRLAIDRAGESMTLQRVLSFATGPLHLETILIAIRDPNDAQIVRIISGSRDLTERQRIEGRLQHAQRLEAVGQLTGGVAHDFNNLLTVVIGNLSLLRRRLQHDERATRYLASVEAAAQRGAKLTASLLAFSRRQTLNVEQLDVAAQIRESATLLRRALGEAIDFSLSVKGDVPPANADASQLEAAVLNLVINARDAIMDGIAARGDRSGQLRVVVSKAPLAASDLMGNDEAEPGEFVAIAVSDTGAGMSQAVRARAFEPFFTTKEIGQGTGLGLSQVFGFVRQLGGHVTIDSTQGEGTTVTVFLPVAMTTQAHDAAEPHEPELLPGGATVLVVEDDASILEITAEMLRDVGLGVITAANGPAALETLRSTERVDLLFSDIVMPGGATGLDLARAAKELRPHLPVLLTSGYAGAALNRYGPMSEFAILAKPYTRALLLEHVGALLSGMQQV